MDVNWSASLYLIMVVVVLCALCFHLGRRSVCDQLALNVEEKCSRVSVIEETDPQLPEVEEVREVGEETAQEPVDEKETSRPPRFSCFRATFEVITRDPKDPEYAKRQAKELQVLVRSIPSVKEVRVSKIEGMEGEKGFLIQ